MFLIVFWKISFLLIFGVHHAVRTHDLPDTSHWGALTGELQRLAGNPVKDSDIFFFATRSWRTKNFFFHSIFHYLHALCFVYYRSQRIQFLFNTCCLPLTLVGLIIVIINIVLFISNSRSLYVFSNLSSTWDSKNKKLQNRWRLKLKDVRSVILCLSIYPRWT